MFVRLLWGILRSSRGRLIVALLALTSGAAVVAALLTLQADVQRKLSGEFRTLGANLIIQPPQALQTAVEIRSAAAGSFLDAGMVEKVAAAANSAAAGTVLAPYLYTVAQVDSHPVVVSGTWLDAAPRLSPWWKLAAGNWIASRDDTAYCLVGRDAARTLGLRVGNEIRLETGDVSVPLRISGVIESGADEDDQIIVSLPVAQKLAGATGKISLISLRNVPGGVAQIESARRALAAAFPSAEVRPVRQVTEAQADLSSRLRLLIEGTVILISLLTLLCVLATMAALAVERRRDVALMRALGGSASRVVSLFLAEAGLLGAISGLAGYLMGIVLARWVGWRVFQAAVSPAWKILPLTVAVMTGIALAGALPLRLLAKTRPGAILRGEP